MLKEAIVDSLRIFYHSKTCLEELRKVSHSGLKTKHSVSENEAGKLVIHRDFQCVCLCACVRVQVKK
jgi:hypothetical protein